MISYSLMTLYEYHCEYNRNGFSDLLQIALLDCNEIKLVVASGTSLITDDAVCSSFAIGARLTHHLCPVPLATVAICQDGPGGG